MSRRYRTKKVADCKGESCNSSLARNGLLERKEFPVAGSAGAEEEQRWWDSAEGIRQLIRGRIPCP